MSFLIRAATPDDAPRLSDLARQAKASWGYPPEWLDQWRDALTITSEYLGSYRGLVAAHDEDILGVCVLALRGQDASLEHVWIAPDRQRQGVGRALVGVALAIAAEAGVTRVEVESDPFAEGFYTGLGARRIGSTPAPMPGAPDRALPLLEFRIGDGPTISNEHRSRSG